VSRLRVGVLVSGQGSNLQALIDAAKDPLYPARVVLVCANKPCPALDIARKAGVSRQVLRWFASSKGGSSISILRCCRNSPAPWTPCEWHWKPA
jgi:folate-dependent phosphoribosylglycinamide formyltransferase PurN